MGFSFLEFTKILGYSMVQFITSVELIYFGYYRAKSPSITNMLLQNSLQRKLVASFIFINKSRYKSNI